MKEETRRRSFLRTGALGVAGAMTVPGDLGAGTPTRTPGRSRARADSAYRVRVDAAARHRDARGAIQTSNGDEERLPGRVSCFSKGLPHDALGKVDAAAYSALRAALASGVPEDFEKIPVAGALKLLNPQASFAFGLEGIDAHAVAVPPAPSFDSAEQAGEACELYWQAVTRDVPFNEYGTSPLIARAAEALSTLSHFPVPKVDGRVAPATIFRGHAAGELIGPYISQFLWKEVPYGAIRVVQHVRTATPGLDYLTTFGDWLASQNGSPATPRHASAYRYVRSGRDLAAYVQLDFTYQAFLSACLILFGMQGTTDAQVAYKGAPFDAGRPYRGLRSQAGFITFGSAHALDLVGRVANEAMKACWYQKWLVHRRLRPEELGHRLHHHRTGTMKYPLHDDILNASVLDIVRESKGSYLLPQAYPEGCPLHPSYPAGHAVIAGACTTALKAFFDESFPVDDPVVASADGLTLIPYEGPRLTIGGELDKLAANIAFGRDFAGVHWRSDGVQGLALGEAVALSILGDMRECFNERFAGFSLTKFDGQKITV